MSKAGINNPGIKFSESVHFFLIAGFCFAEREEVAFETGYTRKKLSRMNKLFNRSLHLKKP
jgi:hypothetical protein